MHARAVVIGVLIVGCGGARVTSVVRATELLPRTTPPTRIVESTAAGSDVSCARIVAVVEPVLRSATPSEAREALADARVLAPGCVVADLLEARIDALDGALIAALAALDRIALRAGQDVVRAERLRIILLEPGEGAARRAMLDCVALPDDDAASRTGCAVAALRLGDRRRAETWLREAVAIEPSSFAAWMDLGALALDHRGYDEAREAFEHAVALVPDAYDAWLGLGAAMRGEQDPHEAERAYRAAAAIDPTRAEAYYDLGLLFQDHRDGSETTLRQAQDFYREFTSHAGSAFPREVDDVRRSCPGVCGPTPPAQRGHRRRRTATRCTPGRVQQIDSSWCGPVHELAEMQAQIAQMQADAQARERAAAEASSSHGAEAQ